MRRRSCSASCRRNCATPTTCSFWTGEADDKVCNIVHLIYRARAYEGIAKDFEFSRRTMLEHWDAGYRNAGHSLHNHAVFELPDRKIGVQTFDFGEDHTRGPTGDKPFP